MNPRALLHPGIFERTGPLGWFVQGEWDLWGSLFPWGIGFPEEDETSGVSVSPIEDGTSGVSFIKEAGNGFEGFLEE